MYTSFFGFKCKPFQLSPDPDFLFMSRIHKRALTYLGYGVSENIGFILLTGEIGTGKTTILRSMIKKIPQDVKLARLYNTRVNSDQLIAMICEDFGIDTAGPDKTQMLSRLTDFLIGQYARGGKSIIVIDEAQNLSAGLLEEIRLLSNLETDKSNLLQIILIGQPELNVTLSRPELRQLRQRIAVTVHLGALTLKETGDYIRHRLRVAGNENGVLFSPGAIDGIYDYSKGIPRLINIICDFALVTAYSDSKKAIDADMIKEIVSDMTEEAPEIRALAVASSSSLNEEIAEKMHAALSSLDRRLQNIEASLTALQEKAPD